MNSERVVILGNFDGVHMGHRALILEGKKASLSLGIPLCAWTFDRVPGNAITDTCARGGLLRHYGVDEIIFSSFEDVKDLTPEQFVENVLSRKLNARIAICGYNYSFGAGGKGTPELLRSLCADRGIKVTVVDKVTSNGNEISSSAIRVLISEGKMKEAGELLTRPFFIRETVKRGAGLGKTVGIPTVNFQSLSGICLPKFGVYATLTDVEGKLYPSVTNVGIRPTLNDGRGITVETHILSFEGDLYEKTITVQFLDFLREEKTFPSLEALSKQVLKDSENAIITAKEFLERT